MTNVVNIGTRKLNLEAVVRDAIDKAGPQALNFLTDKCDQDRDLAKRFMIAGIYAWLENIDDSRSGGSEGECDVRK
jgi:hypothetical protein